MIAKRFNKWALLWMICMFTWLQGFSFPARAEVLVDTEKEASLTLSFLREEEGIGGAVFRLYRVADISEAGGYRAAGNFTGYSVSYDELSSDDWRLLAETLAGYAARDQITPDKEGETNINGELSFLSLRTGLYLVVGDMLETGGYRYTPSPFLVCLPTRISEGNWLYDVNAAVKYQDEKLPEPPVEPTNPTEPTNPSEPTNPGEPTSPSEPDNPEQPETDTYHVVKIWKDEKYTYKRPQSITVELVRDGVVYAKAELNAANNWRHTWTDLEKNHVWYVVEKTVPSNYTVTSTLDGTTFIVTNTYRRPSSGGSDDSSDDSPGTPGTPGRTTTYYSQDPPADSLLDMPHDELILIDSEVPGSSLPDSKPAVAVDMLPQTGMLWWPVPLLAGVGTLCLLAGWFLRKRSGGRTNGE